MSVLSSLFRALGKLSGGLSWFIPGSIGRHIVQSPTLGVVAVFS